MTLYFKNIKINISVYFAAIITFALIFVPNGGAPAALLCCILHEIGHLCAIFISGGTVSGISLGAYGMRIDSRQSFKITPAKEIFISLAGPFVNFILIIFGVIIKSETLIKTNVCLCVFNLLPTGKTDGFSALQNAAELFSDREKANAALKIISTAFLILVYVFGILILIKTKYNFSLLAVAVYMTLINTTGSLKEESI